MEYALKRILPSGIEAALQKADKYRELNQPDEAESICRDVLAIDCDNQLALRTLGLALSDQLDASGGHVLEAQQLFARLRDPYERAFYEGIVCERQAKVQLAARLPFYSVRPLFEQALACYAQAESLRPAGNDDAILRWNSCVRTLQAIPESTASEGGPSVDWEGEFVPRER